ncbi:MAG: PQQ-dependent sugar dehydrogenase, partial [Woeseiaceae bacterium]|nr:PQQ-dependent sugar dehydrogenase [Woeseiaceae bacterium]
MAVLTCALSVIALAARSVYADPGLDTRPSNLTCIAPPRPESGDVVLEPAFPNVIIGGSLTIEFPKGDSSHLFAMRRQGRIYRFPNDPTTSQRTTALDLRPLLAAAPADGQSGLMDMAFHPDFSNNGELYVAYTVPGPDRRSYVAKYTSDDGGVSFSTDGEVLLSLHQVSVFHAIGSLFFGQDGYLYISFGDNNNPNKVQDPFTWYGKILRIDVDSGTPYSIPPDNPYANGGGAPEVYALGFRNPWRVTQDSGGSGEIWAGDVGAIDWEEVDIVTKGGNYGWPIMEGAHCQSAGCDTTGLTDPVDEYSHDDGCAVIGGHVYRGSLLPSLTGKYIFADICTGKISAIDTSGQDTVVETLLESGLAIRDFSELEDGELLITSGNEPRPMKLVPANNSGTQADNFPMKLSKTGCFDPSDPTQVESGVIPFDVNAKLWSDGADKRRWMAVPDGSQIEVLPDGDWEFPVGTVLIKEFQWNGNPFETRLMVRHDDGGWAGYTYTWNASLTDADLVSADGLFRQIEGQLDWMYPSRSQCLQCHSAAAGRSLGPETAQLNGTMLYPSGINSNQLETLEHIGMFSNGLGGVLNDLPALTDVRDIAATLSDRSRSYLHANCANCHRPNGPGEVPMDFRF